jgi:hypothetical protein
MTVENPAVSLESMQIDKTLELVIINLFTKDNGDVKPTSLPNSANWEVNGEEA